MTLEKFASFGNAIAELRASGEQMLRSAMAEFFILVPEAAEVSCTLAVPSFNDGDVCLPSASGLSVEFTDEAAAVLGSAYYYSLKSSKNPRAQEILKVIDQANIVLGDVRLLCNILDYNQQIVATRDSFTIKDYQEEY